MNKPNLFDYASKELSQDAIISWLLQLADPKHNVIDQNLHKCGQELIKKFFDIHGKQLPIITNVEVKKQSNYIDILCVINDEFVIIIEDKKGSKEHSNQLIRYIEHLKKDITIDKIIPIYFQTHEQSDYTDVEDAGYKLFSREDFLTILNMYNNTNCIFLEYKEYLHNLNEKFYSYKSLPLSEWNPFSWQGFYKQLQSDLKLDVRELEKRWDYVANPTGGFFCFYWHDTKAINWNYHLYLQLEEDCFCFKICVADTMKDAETRRIIRNKWSDIITSICSKHDIAVKRPTRFGNGKHMTIAILDQSFPVFNNNILDMVTTIEIAHSAQVVLDECINITL
jgi:hypothetical protein